MKEFVRKKSFKGGLDCVRGGGNKEIESEGVI